MTTLKENDLTPETVVKHLTRAHLSATIDEDGDVYVTDDLDFPVWLTILSNQKLIKIFTFMSLRDDVPEQELFRIQDQLNTQVVLPTFTVKPGDLRAHHYMTYSGGIIVRHLVRMTRRFAGAFRYGFEKHCAELITTSGFKAPPQLLLN